MPVSALRDISMLDILERLASSVGITPVNSFFIKEMAKRFWQLIISLGILFEKIFYEVQGCIQNCNVQRMEACLINLRKLLKIFAGSEKTRYLEECFLGENYEKH